MEFALGIPNEHAESVYQVWEREKEREKETGPSTGFNVFLLFFD